MLFAPSLIEPVAKWAIASPEGFRRNGPARQFCVLQEVNAPEEAWEIKRQIIDAFDLHDAEQEPMFRDLCGLITQGGAVHEHTDPDHNGKQHVRFNVLVSKPLRGGMPVLDGQELELAEGEVWRCDASRVFHSCTTVVGVKPRVVLSFGFLL